MSRLTHIGLMPRHMHLQSIQIAVSCRSLLPLLHGCYLQYHLLSGTEQLQNDRMTWKGEQQWCKCAARGTSSKSWHRAPCETGIRCSRQQVNIRNYACTHVSDPAPCTIMALSKPLTASTALASAPLLRVWYSFFLVTHAPPNLTMTFTWKVSMALGGTYNI